MGIVMRIIQQFDPANEKEFMDLEKKFDELELRRPDFPRGKRMQPISSDLPINSLIWQHEFPDIQSACSVLDFFNSDNDHEIMFREQVKFIKKINVEFYKTLDF